MLKMLRQTIPFFLLVVASALAGPLNCKEDGGNSPSSVDADSDSDADADADSDADSDADPDSDPDVDPDSDSGTDEQPACVGFADVCDTFFESSCDQQEGCNTLEMCSGFASFCFEFDGDETGCTGQLGCTWEASCYGFADSCSLMTNSTDCYDQDGCTWDAVSSACSGVSTSCNSMVSPSSCDSQSGCSWEGSCTGVSTDCSNLSTTSCDDQSGCSVANVCSGVAAECSEYETKDRCGKHYGCTWSVDGSGPAKADAKFCNTLTMNGEELVLYLAISADTGEVVLSANTGECSTPLDDPCKIIPTGESLTLFLEEPDGTILAGYTVEGIAEDDQVIFQTTVEDDSPGLISGALTGGDKCPAATFLKSTLDTPLTLTHL